MFENTYLVTDKLVTFSAKEVDAAEAQLNTAFPAGYREYVTTLGKGEYCGFVWLYGPSEVVNSRAVRQSELTEYAHFWEDGYDVLSVDLLRGCIVVGASIDADLIVFHPDAPDEVFELPRHDSVINKIGDSLGAAAAWYRQQRLKSDFGYFESHIDRKGETLPGALNLSLDSLRDWLQALGQHDHLEEVWNDNPGVSIDVYRLLKGRMDLVAPELGEVTAFYKSFGGYVSAYRDGIGRVSARLVHDTDLNTDTMQTILEYLRSKAV